MKKLRSRWAAALLAIAALGCAESPLDPEAALAQTAGRDGAGPGARGDMVLEHREALGLSDAQVDRIRGILEDLRETNAPLLERIREERGDGGRPDEATRELFERVRENARAAREEALSVLTEEQRAKLDALRPRRGEGGRGGPGMRGRRGPDGPHAFGGPGVAGNLLRLRERLELTEAQVASLRTIGEELRALNRPLMERLRAAGARPGPDDPTVQEMRANAEAARDRALAVLTDAQRARLEALRERAGEGRPGRPGHGGPRGER